MRAEGTLSQRLLDALESAPRRSKPLLALGGIPVIAAISFVDYLTGYELAFSLFYLLPIAAVTWSVGRKTGIAASLLAAAAWGLADYAAGHVYAHIGILFWNTALRLGFFLATTLLLAALKDSLRQERRLSQLDPLTGAANGRRFLEILQAESERSGRYQRPFTLVYLDVDDFKQVNDRYGHNAGDAGAAWRPWPGATCGPRTPWPASGATSSPCCCPKPAGRRRGRRSPSSGRPSRSGRSRKGRP